MEQPENTPTKLNPNQPNNPRSEVFDSVWLIYVDQNQ